MPSRTLQVTETQRRKVRALAGLGLPLQHIAIVAEIDSVETLRQHFEEELTLGPLEAQSNVRRTLFRMASSGQNPAATIFWCKTRLGWTEKGKVDETPGCGGLILEIEEYQPPHTPEQQKLLDEMVQRLDPTAGPPARWEGDRGYYEDDDEVPRRRRLR
jgi:hypothetical protein